MTTPALPHLTHLTATDLRAFLDLLQERGQLHRIAEPISVQLEATELHRRVLHAEGPALLLEHPVLPDGRKSDIPMLLNLFGTVERTAWGLGLDPSALPELGEALAALRSPKPPRDLRAAWQQRDMLRAALNMRPKSARRAACHDVILRGDEVDIGTLPVQWCWPGEPGPLITWPLVITRAPDDPSDINVGVYRMQVLGPRQAIMRWLPSRGGARHFRLWQQKGEDMPVAVAIGADPATVLSAVMPLPDGMNELTFAGVLRRKPSLLTTGVTVALPIPASAEIVLEGRVSVTETAPEGPFGDHTGYYNGVEPFPVATFDALTRRRDAIYLSTYTGRPPDEPSRMGEAMNHLFVPLARGQFSEIRDLHLPPEACSYRAMVVSIDKRYPGQARRVMMGLWSMLPQFSMTKLIIVVDPDIDVRNWGDVLWAISTRFDAQRDLLTLDDTPIDYLDFASPKSGLGGKMGIDATNKIGAETDREWGVPLKMSDEVTSRMDEIWGRLDLGAGRP
nr:UbiD family decarboxylase [uncultured Devosia sp.]